MLNIGQRVKGPHGLGTVVAYNGQKPNTYVQEHLAEIMQDASPIMAAAVMQTFYSSDQYPYVVKFDNGYQDVYSDNDLEIVK